MKADTLTAKLPFSLLGKSSVQTREPCRYALDQAATIFPSTLSRNQHHLYNFSAELSQPVEKDVLQQALENTCRRFPTIAASLHAGLCRYHLEPLTKAPTILDDLTCRLQPLSKRDLRESCLRVACAGHTVSIDFFHALTDGSGALIFVKTLLAEYVRLRYGVEIPAADGVRSCTEQPDASELEDSYAHFAKGSSTAARPVHAYKHFGESDGDLSCVRLCMNAQQIRAKAHEHHVTMTEYLAALMLKAAERTKASDLPRQAARPVRLAIPINLRSHFPSHSLRNFSLCCTVGSTAEQVIDATCIQVHEQLAAQNTAENLAGVMQANARLLQVARVALPLLPMKDAVLKIGYRLLGSNGSSLSMSNLGHITLPEPLSSHVRDLSCCMDTNAYDTHGCTVMTYQNTLSMNFCRSVKSDVLEEHFVALLQDEGIACERKEEIL